MAQQKKPQLEWVEKLSGWLEKNKLFDVNQINSTTSLVGRRIRDAAEALVRYSADTQTSSFEQFTRLAKHIRAVNKEQDREGDWLSQTVDTLIAVADRENRPKSTPTPRHEHVVLLHGLTRSNMSMVRIEQNLLNHGYSVTNINYPSTQDTIEALVDGIVAQGVAAISAENKFIHFVTHSMGGILVRYYLKQHPLDRLGRVVMLSPPNRGSELVDFFGDIPLWQRLNGPAGMQLSTKPDSLPNRLGPVNFELGVIMGTRTVSPILSTLIPGKNDGKVSVNSAKIGGMKDFLLTPTNHTFMMQDPLVVEQVIYFLQHGEFERSGEGAK